MSLLRIFLIASMWIGGVLGVICLAIVLSRPGSAGVLVPLAAFMTPVLASGVVLFVRDERRSRDAHAMMSVLMREGAEMAPPRDDDSHDKTE